MANTCGTCKFWQEEWPADGDDPAGGDCQFPKDRLPLSMSGFAMSEQETVYSNTENCPTWTAPGGEDIPVIEEKPEGVQIAPRWLPMGSVVAGTWDIGDRFEAVVRFALDHREIIRKVGEEAYALVFVSNEYFHNGEESEERDQELYDQLCEALNKACPPFTFFGSHPGNSSDIGVWPDDEEIEEALDCGFRLAKIAHPMDIDTASSAWDYVLIVNKDGSYRELYECKKGVKSLVWKLK